LCLVVQLFGLLAQPEEDVEFALIRSLRHAELAEAKQFVILQANLLPQVRRMLGQPGINHREVRAQ
jgi:hypothetical protein